MKACELKPGEWDRRKAHTNLILTLLKRYRHKGKATMAELKRSDLEQIKLDIIKEMEISAK